MTKQEVEQTISLILSQSSDGHPETGNLHGETVRMPRGLTAELPGQHLCYRSREQPVPVRAGHKLAILCMRVLSKIIN